MRTSDRCLAVLLCVLFVALNNAHGVNADYAPCSDPATCGAIDNCCTSVNEVYYCCPGSGNWLDFNTKRC